MSVETVSLPPEIKITQPENEAVSPKSPEKLFSRMSDEKFHLLKEIMGGSQLSGKGREVLSANALQTGKRSLIDQGRVGVGETKADGSVDREKQYFAAEVAQARANQDAKPIETKAVTDTQAAPELQVNADLEAKLAQELQALQRAETAVPETVTSPRMEVKPELAAKLEEQLTALQQSEVEAELTPEKPIEVPMAGELSVDGGATKDTVELATEVGAVAGEAPTIETSVPKETLNVGEIPVAPVFETSVNTEPEVAKQTENTSSEAEKTLTPEEASQLTPEELNARLAQMSEEARQDFLHGWADTETKVNETVESIQSYQGEKLKNDGIDTSKPQIFEDDGQGNAVPVESEEQSGEATLPEPSLPETADKDEQNMFEITENVDESLNINDNEEETIVERAEEDLDEKEEIVDLNNTVEQNTDTSVVNQENIEEEKNDNVAILEGNEMNETAEEAVEQSEEGESAEEDAETVAGQESDGDEGVSETEAQNREELGNVINLEDLIGRRTVENSYANRLEAVQSEKLSEHEALIEKRQEEFAQRKNAGERVETTWHYLEVGDELKRQMLKLARMKSEVGMAA